MKEKSVLVIFGEELPYGGLQHGCQYDTVVASERLQQEIQAVGLTFVPIESFVKAGSIYEASALFEELSQLTLPNGTCLAKSFLYKGYELWWIHCGNLFLYFCLPYTQYKNLLTHIKDFQDVFFYRPPYVNLFSYYLKAYGNKIHILQEPGRAIRPIFPFGIFLQIVITLISLPLLVLMKRRFMLYIGDKFKKNRDYDFRMEFIYEELRRGNILFVEFIRSLESWKIVLQHAFVRRRPVIYSEAVAFVGRFCSSLSGGHRRAQREFGARNFDKVTNPEKRFKLLIASQYLLTVYDDIWTIRIMKLILRMIGVKAAFIPSATERNFPVVLGCKLVGIPTVGIQHGITPRHYAVSEFMDGFDGEKSLSVDRYGLWSEGWRQYFIKYSKVYKPEQLYVSGSMRPLQKQDMSSVTDQAPKIEDKISVLFISEQLAEPAEVLPYLSALINSKEFSVHLKIRPYRDGFEEWLKKNRPEILNKVKIIREDIHQAIASSDVVVGSHSTAVLEALSQLKPFVFFQTQKWGDYFEIKSFNSGYLFFAENPQELSVLVRERKSTPQKILQELQLHFLGDPYKNGGKWVVEQAEELLSN